MKLFENFKNWIACFLGFERSVGAIRTRWTWKNREKVVPVPVSVPQPEKIKPVEKPIEYVLNDMSTPDLLKIVQPPQIPEATPFLVLKYDGGGHAKGTEAYQAANCYVTIANTLNFLNQHTDIKLKKWANTRTLYIVPRAGKDLNAFYNRKSMQFFYVDESVYDRAIFTADSSDIVAHELGHAILDSYRPETWNAASMEVWSFHEAFADFTAIMNIMSHDEVIDYALLQNGNDMKKPSIISNLAEDLGKAVFKIDPSSGRSPLYLRSSINSFKYVNPGNLPKDARFDAISSDPHSFGRIMLGALYDILVIIYDDLVSKGQQPNEALKNARDFMAKRILKTIQDAPINSRFFESIAKTMLWVEKVKFNDAYYDKMRNVFLDRNIMRPEVRMLSAPKCENEDKIIKIQSTMNIKLSDHLLRAQSNNILYDVELEIPCEQVYLYDLNDSILDVISVSSEESIGNAQDMITYLNDNNLVGEGENTPFGIQNGKLTRTHFEVK